MKYIREGRFGPPKSFKTGAVVGTYPKPMLVLEFDAGGLDIIPTTPQPDLPNRIKCDCLQSDITYIDAKDISTFCKKKTEELSKVTCIDFTKSRKFEVTEKYEFTADKDSFIHVINVINSLKKVGCPWKTIVIDPATDLIDMIISHLTATNHSAMETKGTVNPQRWAPLAAGKFKQIIDTLHSIDVNCVTILHDTMKEIELTHEIRIQPMLVSQLRDRIGASFSYYFYATKEGDKAVVYTTDKGFVKGIGGRNPVQMPTVCGADFNSIYGKEIL